MKHVRRPVFDMVGILGLVFIIFGLLSVYDLFLRPYMTVLRARNWEEAQCEIVVSHLHQHQIKGKTVYTEHIAYRYSFKGKSYASSRYSLFHSTTTEKKLKQRIINRYPQGEMFTCYINPTTPTEAVLNRDYPSRLWKGIFPLLLTILGFLLLGNRYLNRNKPLLIKEKERPSESCPPSYHALSPGNKLRIGHNIQWTDIVLLIIAIIGLVPSLSDILSPVTATDTPRGIRNVILIFLLAVVLSTLICVFIRFLMKQLNPRPYMFVDTSGVPVSSDLNFYWELRGGLLPVHHLIIHLEGHVEIISHYNHQLSKNERISSKKKLVFRRKALELKRNQIGLNGSSSVKVPTEEEVKRQPDILWSLRVIGTVNFWPDIEVDFPVALQLPDK